ncbi:very short patch repair endonuclease [Sphingopyxis sp. 550A]
MSRVPSKNTSAEIRVRSAAHRRKLRFRIHRKDLPGTPDLVFAKWGIAIFVHGCFWHRHPDCKKASTPKSREEFWQEKFNRNVQRDRENEKALQAKGWRTEIVWECETKSPEILGARLDRIFGLSNGTNEP